MNKERVIKGFIRVHKRVNQLKPGELTFPKKGGRYRGVSVGRDKRGFFVYSAGKRSKSYKSPLDIPDGVIKKFRREGNA